MDYFMPPEWHTHKGTLLAWPTNTETWEGLVREVHRDFAALAAEISRHELLYLMYNGNQSFESILQLINDFGGELKQIRHVEFPYNDSWCRDMGPNYVFRKTYDSSQNPVSVADKKINGWGYNAWGGKYPPFDDDAKIRERFAAMEGILYEPIGLILEGGSIDVNGKGILLTTEACLLNPNRNPHLNKFEIETALRTHLGVNDILWLKDGVEGDDTDGHVDDFARFLTEDTIVCARSDKKGSQDYVNLEENWKRLSTMAGEHHFNLVSLPMPTPVEFRGEMLPASYANFYFVNDAVLVPVFNCPEDEHAISLFERHCPNRKIIPLQGSNFVRGLGGIHCLTQQIY